MIIVEAMSLTVRSSIICRSTAVEQDPAMVGVNNKTDMLCAPTPGTDTCQVSTVLNSESNKTNEILSLFR